MTRLRTQNTGEVLFEEYVRSQGFFDFEYEKERAGKSARPDYSLLVDGQEYLFEVKDFPAETHPTVFPEDEYKRLRQRIGKLGEKFREFKGWPCCGVFYNDNSRVYLSAPRVMLGAMYGNLETGFRSGTNWISKQHLFSSGGKMIPRSLKTKRAELRHTRISAIITLRYVRIGFARLCNHFRDMKKRLDLTLAEALEAPQDFDSLEQQLGVIVWENELASIRFPRQLFNGPYDARYGVDDQGILRRLHSGSGVVEYEALMDQEDIDDSFGSFHLHTR